MSDSFTSTSTTPHNPYNPQPSVVDGISLNPNHFNSDITQQLTMRSLTPLSREVCALNGINPSDLTRKSLEYFQSLPMLRKKSDQVIQNAASMYEKTRLNNIQTVQQTYIHLNKKRMDAYQEQLNNKKPSSKTLLQQERQRIEHKESKIKESVKQDILSAAETARRLKMQRETEEKLYLDQELLRQEQRDQYNLELESHVYKPVVIQPANTTTGTPDVSGRMQSESMIDRYRKYKALGVHAGTINNITQAQSQDTNSPNHSKRVSKEVLFKALASKSPRREKNVEMEIILSEHRQRQQDILREEQNRHKHLLREKKLREMKDYQDEQQIQREERLWNKYDKLDNVERARSERKRQELDAYSQSVNSRLTQAKRNHEDHLRNQDKLNAIRRMTIIERDNRSSNIKKENDLTRLQIIERNRIRLKARDIAYNKLKQEQDIELKQKEQESLDKLRIADQFHEDRVLAHEQRLQELKEAEVEMRKSRDERQVLYREQVAMREVQLEQQRQDSEERRQMALRVKEEQNKEKQSELKYQQELRKQKVEQSQKAYLYKQTQLKAKIDEEDRQYKLNQQEQVKLKRAVEKLHIQSKLRINSLIDVADKVKKCDNLYTVDVETLGEGEDITAGYLQSVESKLKTIDSNSSNQDDLRHNRGMHTVPSRTQLHQQQQQPQPQSSRVVSQTPKSAQQPSNEDAVSLPPINTSEYKRQHDADARVRSKKTESWSGTLYNPGMPMMVYSELPIEADHAMERRHR